MDNREQDRDASASEESFIVLDDVARQQTYAAPSISEAADRMLDGRTSTFSSQESASRLLGLAGNPTQMTAILAEIWQPDAAPFGDNVADEVPSRQGRVVDVDVEDFLFAIEDDLKKLLSVIVYKRTGFVAKTAAVDVFTWLCSLDVVIDNPAFSKEDICKWTLSLCRNRDPRTVSSGLRGIRNLVLQQDYRNIVTASNEFVKILDHLQDASAAVCHADVYVFEIYHTVMTANGSAPAQDVLLEKLLSRMQNDSLSSEAQRWGMQCIETCIHVFENRVSVIERLLNRHDILAWLVHSDESLLSQCLDVIHACLEHIPDEKELLTSIIERRDVMAKLFGYLKCGLSNAEVGILKLVHWLAHTLPNAFHSDHLDDQWVKFQILLEKATDEGKQWVINILHTLAVNVTTGEEERLLPLPDGGLPFVKLLLTELTDETFDIIYFIWSHYKDFLPILSEVKLVSAILTAFMTSDWMLWTQNLDKIHLFFEAVVNTGENPEADFKDCLMKFLNGALSAENTDYVRLCLKIGLYLLVKLDVGGTADFRWVMDEGLVSFMTELMDNTHCLKQLENPSNLFHVLKKVFLLLVEEPERDHAQNDACCLFVLTLNAANIFGIDAVTGFLGALKHDVADHVLFDASAEMPAAILNAGLNLAGLLVLQELIQSWTPEDAAEFLNALLTVLLKGCLEHNSEEQIEDSCILVFFVEILLKLPAAQMTEETMHSMLSCIAAGAEKSNTLLSEAIVQADDKAMMNLWDLFMNSHGRSLLSVAQEKSILSLLEYLSKPCQNSSEKEEKSSALYQENVALQADNLDKSRIIEGLEKKLADAFSEIQGLNDLIVDEGPSCPTESAQALPDTVMLETMVKRLKRQIEEKEDAIVALNDRNQKLLIEIRNRDEANTAMVEVVDNLYSRISLLEEILKSEGFQLDGDHCTRLC